MYEERKEGKSDYEVLRKNHSKINQKKESILSNPINFKKNITSKLITRANSNIFPKNNKDNKGIQTYNYNLFAIDYLNAPFNKKEEYQIQKTFTEFFKNKQYKEHSNIIYRNDKELTENTTSFFNKTYNEKNQINDLNLPNLLEIKKKKLTKRDISSKKDVECPCTGAGNNDFIKRSKSNLIDKKHRNIFNNPINRYLSSRIYPGLKRKKQNTKNIISNDKNNLNINRCVSPSTTNNSNLNSNNSSNKNYKMSITSNIFPKKSKNNINEINGNNIKNINGNNMSKNIQEKDIKMTAIEYQLNQLLARKEKEKEKTKKKYKENENDNEGINIEELYSKYLDEKAKKLSFNDIEKDDTIHSNKKYNNASQKVDYLITKNNYINNFINANKNKKINSGINEDLSYGLWLTKNIDYKRNKNKIFSNPIIRYAFFDKMINNITRKVSIVNKSSGKELELNISQSFNEKNDKTGNNIDKKYEKNKDFKTFGYELMPEKVLTNKNEKEEKKEQQIKKPNPTFFMNTKNKSTLHKNKYDKKNNIEESKNITKENIRNILNGDIKNKNKAYCLIDNNLSNIQNRNDNKLKFSFTYTNGNTSQNYDYLDCLGDSSRRNKLNWNLISESDKEQGRILWKKLTANTPSISNKKSNNSSIINKKQINTNDISNIIKYPKVKEEIINIIKNKSCNKTKLKENKKDDSQRQKHYYKRRNSSMIFQNIKNLKLFNGLKDNINISEDEEEEESEDSDKDNEDRDKDKDKAKDDIKEKNKSRGSSINNNGNNNEINKFEKSPKLNIRKQKRYETHRLDKKSFLNFEKEKGFEKIDSSTEKEEEELELVEKKKEEGMNEFEEEKVIKEVTEEKEKDSKIFCKDDNKINKSINKSTNKSMNKSINKSRNKSINKSIYRYSKTNTQEENTKNNFINLSKSKYNHDNKYNNDKKATNLNLNLFSALFHKKNNNRNKLKNQDLIGLSEYAHSSSSNKSSKSIKKIRYKVKVKDIIEIKNNKNKFEVGNELNKEIINDKNESKISNNKNQSLIIEDNQILDDLIPNEFKDENELIDFHPNISKKEVLCLSEDNTKSKRYEKYRKKILESSSSSQIIKKVNHLELFDSMCKNYKPKYQKDEDEKMNKYYEEIYNKYGKENEKTNIDNLVEIKIFGLDFKIPIKVQKNYYKKFMKNIRLENIKRREERKINQRLSFLLDKYSLQKLKEKNNKILKQRKSKINNIGVKKYFGQNKNFNWETQKKQMGADAKAVCLTEATKNENNEEGKLNPKKEMEMKKTKLLLKLKHDVKYKIHIGEMKDSEMDNFNKFKKKINEIALEGDNIELYIKQLEQRFHSYEKELKLKEEKRDEESRINSFIDSMKYDFHIKKQIKHIQEKIFFNAVDFKQKNIINKLSPVQANNKNNFSKNQEYKK